MPPSLRPAALDDLPGIHRVWWATGEEGRNNPWFAHVLGTGRLWVATDAGQVVGFAGVRSLGGATAISDCFVDPSHHGKGIGHALLGALTSPGEALVTLASDHPRARPLYSRFGLEAVVECPYLEGDPAALTSPPFPVVETTTYPVDPADLRHLRHDLGCRLLRLGEEGGAAVTPTSLEASMTSGRGELAVASALAWLAAQGSRRVEVQLATSHPGYPLLLERGFLVKFADTLMATPGAELPDYSRTTFNGDFLIPEPHS